MCEDTLTGGNVHNDTFTATRCSHNSNKQAHKNNAMWKSEYDPSFPCVTGSHMADLSHTDHLPASAVEF